MDHQTDGGSALTNITLELETIKLVINPAAGASISSLMIKEAQGSWAPVLRTMTQGSRSADDAGSFVMLPWTNRIKDARFIFQDKDFHLRSNAPDNSAIHGIARDLPWTIADRSPITARLVFDSRIFDPDSINYPFRFGAVERFEIGPRSVEIDLSITNLDDRPIPVGCGHHPYISRQLFSDADDLRITLDVAGRYPTKGCIPIGDPVDDPICARLRAGDRLGELELDDVFAGFGGKAIFDWAASNVRMTMSCSDNLNHVVIYTPKDQSDRPAGFVCVEPTSIVNDGFNRHARGKTGTGVMILEPNQTMRTQLTLAFSRCTP